MRIERISVVNAPVRNIGAVQKLNYHIRNAAGSYRLSTKVLHSETRGLRFHFSKKKCQTQTPYDMHLAQIHGLMVYFKPEFNNYVNESNCNLANTKETVSVLLLLKNK